MPESPTLSRLAPPPRSIPPVFAVLTMLGGTSAQIGWFFLGFGSIFFWAFVWNADLSGWRFRPETMATIRGVSLGCRQTGFSEGTKHYPHRIYQNLYRYSVEGQDFRGASFAVDQCTSRGAVSVEYLRLDPAVSRIAGMRRQPVSPWGALVALLPGAGLCLIVAGVFRGRWSLRLLRDGQPAAARLIDKTATGSRTMGRPDYRMDFEYTAQNGAQGRASLRTNQPEPLEGAETLVFYDPADLSRGLLFPSLPGDVAIGSDGQPTRTGSRAFLVLPLATLIGNACYVLYRGLS